MQKPYAISQVNREVQNVTFVTSLRIVRQFFTIELKVELGNQVIYTMQMFDVICVIYFETDFRIL